ncbi:patatin-like phospholipase family protein [Pikeienuella piscinae]|uniref:Patatin-like phospholipase family protein n=1 Tax=Pikeienuella piscinae TaxID=2748098 RepID=A0A7M3T6U3_9RHOB|nr:patatin-like phospholipase family protein [Pikeienuella piscinae]
MSERPGKIGLVLQGGGARGAYQVGALKAVAEITGRRRSPFQIVCGASVGAINAAPLAAASSNFQWGTRRLEALWRSLKSDAVYVTSAPTILATAFKWFWALMFSRNGAPSALLDNAPLARLLEREFDRRQLERAIRAGTLHALCITAASFSTGRAVTFFTGHGEIEEWRRARRRGVRAEIGARHLVASSSLPFIFAPVKLSDQYFGDGSLRLTAPLSPAIRAGADRLFVIAARDNLPDEGGAADAPAPTFGEMAGHALDILFNDNLDADHERLTRINNTVSLLSEDARSKTPLREIETLRLSPSQDLRDFAVRYANEMPAFIRLLMRSIGSWGKDGRLISYLLFEPGYITALIDLGYADTMARRDEVRQFLRR